MWSFAPFLACFPGYCVCSGRQKAIPFEVLWKLHNVGTTDDSIGHWWLILFLFLGFGLVESLNPLIMLWSFWWAAHVLKPSKGVPNPVISLASKSKWFRSCVPGNEKESQVYILQHQTNALLDSVCIVTIPILKKLQIQDFSQNHLCLKWGKVDIITITCQFYSENQIYIKKSNNHTLLLQEQMLKCKLSII